MQQCLTRKGIFFFFTTDLIKDPVWLIVLWSDPASGPKISEMESITIKQQSKGICCARVCRRSLGSKHLKIKSLCRILLLLYSIRWLADLKKRKYNWAFKIFKEFVRPKVPKSSRWEIASWINKNDFWEWIDDKSIKTNPMSKLGLSRCRKSGKFTNILIF